MLASTAMIASTVGLAAAANYPAPFVQNGAANVAVVYGSTAAATDLVAVTDIVSNLQAKLAAQTASGGTTSSASVSGGEAYALFTSSSALQINASLSSVRSSVTESNLPTVLTDGTFSGNVDADMAFSIDVGSNPRVQFLQQPTSDDDPVAGIAVGTTATNYLYNATISFNKAVNFTHADSEGETITLFGQDFTVASATDFDDLVLLKSTQTVDLSSDVNPSATVVVGEKEYTITLVSATDTDARITVTDSAGKSETKSINEDASKTVNGVEVAVTFANEDTALNKLQAEIIVGTSRLTLTSGQEVKIGTDDVPVDGTNVYFTGDVDAITKIVVQAFAPEGDMDAITPGNSFVDPVFGSFKVDFSGLSIPTDSTAREAIDVKTSGNDKMTIAFTNWQGKSLTNTVWLNNETGNNVNSFLGDSSENRIFVQERAQINESAYAVVGNEDEGYLVKLRTLTNSSSATASDDSVIFENVFDSSQTWQATISAEGSGTVDIGGKSYGVTYLDNRAGDGSQAVRLNYPDSSANDMILYPTIETSKGAKLFFYEPLTIDLSNWDGLNNNVTAIVLPDGDGYDYIYAAPNASIGSASSGVWNFSLDSAGEATLDTQQINVTAGTLDSADFAIGKLVYNISSYQGAANGSDVAKIRLETVAGLAIDTPAIVLFEEQDEGNTNHAVIIQTAGGGDADNGVGVSNVDFTWNSDAGTDGDAYGVSGLQLQSNENLYSMMDLWGTIVTTDQSTSDQYTATISYPSDQVTANVYVAGVDAAISGGTVSGGTVTELGSIAVSDAEVGSVSSKNLVVVGGSCINTVAADLLGGALCGADFEASTSVGAGSFLIETFDRTSGKVATLVAGYNAGDTSNAAKALTTQVIDTTVGKKYTGQTSTSVSLATA